MEISATHKNVMRKKEWGVALADLIIISCICGLAILIAVKGEECNGKCASVQCTEEQPCDFNGVKYTLGSACAPGTTGTVCQSHWWPFKDCTCATSVGTGGALKTICYK